MSVTQTIRLAATYWVQLELYIILVGDQNVGESSSDLDVSGAMIKMINDVTG